MKGAHWLLALASLSCASAAPDAELAECEARFAAPCVVAGARYERARPHRWMFGGGYRELWGEPIPAPRLDLEQTAGGLTPLRVVGNMQSRNLALRGADGRAYTFRSIDKDPSRLVPIPLRWIPPTPQLFRDQTASNHPGAPLVARALARAAGSLEPQPVLVSMPDDERLGAFREAFAGMPGTFEEYPTAATETRPGTFGATEILDSRELERLLAREGPQAVDARAYLRARLVDLLLGDPDRHPGQWRWARLAGRGAGDALVPLPEDRDLAFARFEGVALSVARPFVPLLSLFDEEIDVEALSYQSKRLDRRLLAGLDREAWDEQVREVTARITPEAIRDAVARLPEPWREASGPALERRLARRLRSLPAAARELRAIATRELDVHGSGRSDVFSVEAGAEGDVRVSVSRPGPEGPVLFARRLDPDETERIRLCGPAAGDVVALEDVAIEVERAAACPESALRMP